MIDALTTWNHIKKSPDGTYVIQEDAVLNFGERWAFGYIVAIRELQVGDIKNGTMFGVWTDEDGKRYYDIVRHIHAYSDAVKFGKDHDQKAIWDLREEKAVYL